MQEEKTTQTNIKRRKRKKQKRNYLYLYLFAFVFVIALAGFSYLVKSYSPDVDVTIGNNDSLPLSESDMDVEIKSVDERLKWIQMEDEMPTVARRGTEVQENPMNIDFLPNMEEENIEQELRKKEEKKKVVIPAPTPTMSEIQKSRVDFRTASSSNTVSSPYVNGPIPRPTRIDVPVVPLPTTSVTKVYLGSFNSLEDAMETQQEINSRDSSIMPFIKATNNTYIVQLGSFTDSEKANNLVQKIKSMGYSPKIVTSN